jgi:peptide chain release factor 2
VDVKLLRIQDEELLTHAPNFWENPKKAEEVLKSIRLKKVWTDGFARVQLALEDLTVLWEFAESGEKLEDELENQFRLALDLTEELELKNMLSAEEDQMNCVITINSGAGGTESQDWAEMLMRMYIMYCDKQGFKAKVIDEQAGDGAGIKSCSIEVEGEFAYGYLKGENGVHRLVRISPFDANARRHTSFASVYCYPIVDDSIEIDVDKIKINTTKEININNKDSMIILNKGIQLCGGVCQIIVQQDRLIDDIFAPKIQLL